MSSERQPATEFINELEEKFEWECEKPADSDPPELLYWPVRLRPLDVIHSVQAIAAAALSVRGLRVVLGIEGKVGDASVAVRRIQGWMDRIDDNSQLNVVSLDESLRKASSTISSSASNSPTDAWSLAKGFYGKRSDPLSAILEAVKVEPPAGERSAVDAMNLLHTAAERLQTPLKVASGLHQLFDSTSPSKIMTLGGVDEKPFWHEWRKRFDLPVSHLYLPKVSTQPGQPLDWNHASEFKPHLHPQAMESRLASRYVWWVINQAGLLPAHIRGETVKINEHWIQTAVNITEVLQEPSALPVVADLATAHYLDRPLRWW